MNPFKSKIKCSHCQKFYRLKTEKGTRKFICGGYHNGNGCTNRLAIREDFLRDLINRRFQKELDDIEISEILDYILIVDKLKMEVHFLDKSEPILLKESFIQY